MYSFKPGDIVTVPYWGGPPGCRLRCVVLEGARPYTRTPFERRKEPTQVVAVHLRYLEGLDRGTPCTVQAHDVLAWDGPLPEEGN
jgi:hypothetical protein